MQTLYPAANAAVASQGGGAAAATAAGPSTAAATTTTTTTTAASSGGGCGSTMCCVATDYLLCCGAIGTIGLVGGVLACGGGGGNKMEYNQFCGECEANAAILECTECHEIYCQPCYDKTHATGRYAGTRKGHRATRHKRESIRFLVERDDAEFYLSAAQVCGECSDDTSQVRATVFCADCKEVFCHSCKIKVHSKGLRARHQRYIPLLSGENNLTEEFMEKNFPPRPPSHPR